MSTQCVDVECVSDAALEVVQMKRAMMAAAQKVTLLIDSSKFASRAIYRIAPISEIDEIITDNGIGDDELDRYRALGIKATAVDVGD